MTWTSTLPKARVRRVWFMGGWTWEASRPGETYLVACGWHFYTWEAAIAFATYATARTPVTPEPRGER